MAQLPLIRQDQAAISPYIYLQIITIGIFLLGHVRQSGQLMVGQTGGVLGPVNFK